METNAQNLSGAAVLPPAGGQSIKTEIDPGRKGSCGGKVNLDPKIVQYTPMGRRLPKMR